MATAGARSFAGSGGGKTAEFEQNTRIKNAANWIRSKVCLFVSRKTYWHGSLLFWEVLSVLNESCEFFFDNHFQCGVSCLEIVRQAIPRTVDGFICEMEEGRERKVFRRCSELKNMTK